ncbi:MAG: hypothetical protein IJA63_02420 [Akkermansia sp.]|nr:hypothetical protein [Akkermansia sp.]
MAGFISEFFGYKAEDSSKESLQTAMRQICPFLGKQCTKVLKDRTIAGVCAIRQKTEGSPDVICCPNRLYADDYRMLRIVAQKAFGLNLNLYAGRAAVDKAKQEDGAIAVFGHGWGGELRLPQRQGSGSYFVDWVLARLDANGKLVEFTAIEVQTIDTTGSYGKARLALGKDRSIISDTVGLNWENVAKRIIPQIIYKGQVLQREDLCKTGLFFVCPKPIYDRVINRLGGVDKIMSFPMQPASINFLAYDYAVGITQEGKIAALDVVEEHSTTVYKVQEAFSAMSLPDGNVYREAITKSLYSISQK